MPADALMGLVGIAVLLAVFYGPWQSVCNDIARNEIFRCRDELFDMAADGHLAFDSAEYINIRSGLNSLIRFADRLSVPRILFMIAMRRNENQSAAPSILKSAQAIESLDARRRVEQIIARSMLASFKMVIVKSSVFLVFLSVLYVIFFVQKRLAKWIAFPAVRLSPMRNGVNRWRDRISAMMLWEANLCR